MSFLIILNKNWFLSLVLRQSKLSQIKNVFDISHYAISKCTSHGRLYPFCNKRIIEKINQFRYFSLSLSVIICLAKFFAAKNYNVVFIVIKFELTAVYISSKNTFKRWMVIYFIRVNTVSKNNIAHGKFKKKCNVKGRLCVSAYAVGV